ncbi:hypothetical protein ACFXTH_025611 [Malus domestica]
MSQLHPISLCNALYKIGAKVITNRLKGMMSMITSTNQSVFMPRRLILDNSLVAVEIGHYLRNKRNGREGSFALKLDLSKAYDRVKWCFLEAIMVKLGFDTDWIKMVMACIKSVSYSFLINGQPSGYLIPSRGLRQGDPLSPYLFDLCVEGLSALIIQNEQLRQLSGIRLCKEASTIHHLLFDDDSFLFGRVNVDECAMIQHILDIYSQASSQSVNFGQSSVVFSANVLQYDQQMLAGFLSVSLVEWHERYLGLPTCVGKNKKQTFSYIKERVTQGLNGWKSKLLSSAGNELLIKVVAQTLTAYAMNCFLLPKTFCDELHQLMAHFWWGNGSEDWKIHWRSWDKMCKSKVEG